MISPGEDVRLMEIRGGQRMRKRLADLGLTIGMTLCVIKTDQHGPVILRVKDSRLVIGRAMAYRIFVDVV
jgi:ferrous iron transport protein A